MLEKETQMQLRLGSLFSGFGGLDLAIERVFDARTVWVSDIEPGPCKVLAHRWPGVPNLGDITTIDWAGVEPVDIIAGGSPCQDISSAGRMAGMREGTRSNLWVEMREAIRILRPRLVVWENVSAARSTAAASAMESDPGLLGDHPAGVPALRALGRVLGDLASLRYDAQWHSLRASDVGAPHGRLRYFILAADARSETRFEWSRLCETQPGGVWRGRPDNDDRQAGALTCSRCGHATNAHRWYSRCVGTPSQPDCICELTPHDVDRHTIALLPTPTTQDASNVGGPSQLNRNTPPLNAVATTLLPTPRATDGTKGGPNQRGSSGDLMLPSAVAMLPTPRATRGGSTTEISYALGGERSDEDRPQGQVLLPTPSVADTQGGRKSRSGDRSGELLLNGIADQQAWGPYAAAIARWEAIHGPAPSPTKLGKKGRPKLNPAFAEWMMGAAPGWITDVPGVTDNEALRMAGNGVVEQQAELALHIMADRFAYWSTR